MTLLRYYKPINANVNKSKNKDKLNEKDKSLSESDESNLSLSETSLSEISTEEINEIDEKNSQRSSKKRKISKSCISKRKTKAKINKKGFQKKWLKEFSWLKYDSKEKKMHCELCRFHGINIPFTKEGITITGRMKGYRLVRFQQTTIFPKVFIPTLPNYCLLIPNELSRRWILDCGGLG
ncbi:uncharacterized protein OCT59_009660 [Rhizophagus irregularis]|uniref:uncharacterized protein n=1 Tax=Rhizophagus irregularis TaxID=588596 RepID=UPI00332DF438|nr:hypothetical protein OCT59_009660 [Rhizophagus irregularis]